MTMSNETQETKPRKSDLLLEHKQLLERNDVLLKEMQEREYEVDFKSKSIFTSLLKFLEKESPWGHTTAAGLILLYNNMRQQKQSINDNWDGVVKLRSANVSILWTMITQMKGNGFYEARRFVELMATIGETLSKAVQQVHFDNQSLRENHARINDIENLLMSPDIIHDVEEETVNHIATIASEVDPMVENA
jgi:hypothetical protein